MANKINAKLILELKASGLSRNQIAATRHMSKHSVSDVINIAREKDITYEKVNHLSEDEVYRMIFPDKFAVENLYEQPDYEYVHTSGTETCRSYTEASLAGVSGQM